MTVVDLSDAAILVIIWIMRYMYKIVYQIITKWLLSTKVKVETVQPQTNTSSTKKKNCGFKQNGQWIWGITSKNIRLFRATFYLYA